ncbi:hypothetical protein BS47DRAFT_1366943 [Hydnum rufescens UP504]|uniref:Uncharacterized protein n=1 Tax=Hydnum rufescens UP504 TaxID=1448309 RepID=A0A9P6AJL7_9AGAM|nr:hypothetical protein BS47DRAFT_1366943 [Hydnum rufescens UP504]
MVDRTMVMASRLGDTSFSVQIRTCELLEDNGRPLRDRRGLQDRGRYGMGAVRLRIQKSDSPSHSNFCSDAYTPLSQAIIGTYEKHVNPREVISHDSLLLARGSDDSEASCLPGRLLAAMPVAAFNGLAYSIAYFSVNCFRYGSKLDKWHCEECKMKDTGNGPTLREAMMADCGLNATYLELWQKYGQAGLQDSSNTPRHPNERTVPIVVAPLFPQPPDHMGETVQSVGLVLGPREYNVSSDSMEYAQQVLEENSTLPKLALAMVVFPSQHSLPIDRLAMGDPSHICDRFLELFLYSSKYLLNQKALSTSSYPTIQLRGPYRTVDRKISNKIESGKSWAALDQSPR